MNEGQRVKSERESVIRINNITQSLTLYEERCNKLESLNNSLASEITLLGLDVNEPIKEKDIITQEGIARNSTLNDLVNINVELCDTNDRLQVMLDNYEILLTTLTRF